jgi:hypothetical protein
MVIDGAPPGNRADSAAEGLRLPQVSEVRERVQEHVLPKVFGVFGSQARQEHTMDRAAESPVELPERGAITHG